jgi:hypothetical protein
MCSVYAGGMASASSSRFIQSMPIAAPEWRLERAAVAALEVRRCAVPKTAARPGVLAARHQHRERALERRWRRSSKPSAPSPNDRAAQLTGSSQRCAGHVLDHVRQARFLEELARRGDEVGVRDRVLAERSEPCTAGTAARRGWRRSSDPDGEHIECVTSMELERVVRLLGDVDAHDLEARPCVAHPRTAGAAEEVEQARPHTNVRVRIGPLTARSA